MFYRNEQFKVSCLSWIVLYALTLTIIGKTLIPGDAPPSQKDKNFYAVRRILQALIKK